MECLGSCLTNKYSEGAPPRKLPAPLATLPTLPASPEPAVLIVSRLARPARRALLRRQPADRPDRAPGPEARPGGVRPGPGEVGRQRAAVFRQHRQLRRAHRRAVAARPADGARPAVGRPPDARVLHAQEEDLLLLHLLRVAAVHARRQHGLHRYGQAGRAGRRVQPEAAHRGRLGVPAGLGLRALPRDCEPERRDAHDGHGPHLRHRRRQGVQQSLRVLRHRERNPEPFRTFQLHALGSERRGLAACRSRPPHTSRCAGRAPA